jgi:hypothetical protein
LGLPDPVDHSDPLDLPDLQVQLGLPDPVDHSDPLDLLVHPDHFVLPVPLVLLVLYLHSFRLDLQVPLDLLFLDYQ